MLIESYYEKVEWNLCNYFAPNPSWVAECWLQNQALYGLAVKQTAILVEIVLISLSSSFCFLSTSRSTKQGWALACVTLYFNLLFPLPCQLFHFFFCRLMPLFQAWLKCHCPHGPLPCYHEVYSLFSQGSCWCHCSSQHVSSCNKILLHTCFSPR